MDPERGTPVFEQAHQTAIIEKRPYLILEKIGQSQACQCCVDGRAGTKVTEVEASHSVHVARSEQVAAVIAEAVAACIEA